MRKILLSAVMAATAVPAIVIAQDSLSDAMLKASSGSLSPLQMPDGSKLWRFAGKALKGEDIDLRYMDLIAQALARADWCGNGWEETKRSTPTSGFVFIEGRCK